MNPPPELAAKSPCMAFVDGLGSVRANPVPACNIPQQHIKANAIHCTASNLLKRSPRLPKCIAAQNSPRYEQPRKIPTAISFQSPLPVERTPSAVLTPGSATRSKDARTTGRRAVVSARTLRERLCDQANQNKHNTPIQSDGKIALLAPATR